MPGLLILCDREDERALVGAALAELGADGHAPELRVGADGSAGGGPIDLIVAGGLERAGAEARLRELLGRFEGGEEPPLIILAPPEALDGLAARLADRPHALLLARPVGPLELASVVRSALAYRAGQRANRELVERLRLANAELDRRRREAEAEARRRTQLLAAISHDLRTPIHEIVLFGQVARAAIEVPDPPIDWPQLALGLQAAVDSLRELVDDLFDIARFDLGTLEFRESTFALGPFLSETLAPLRASAQWKELPLIVAALPAEASIRTDRAQLGRIVQNLVSNAVKFTEAGGVWVTARAEPGCGLVIAVRDTGRGIAPEARATIFDEFVQLHNPERDRKKGTGLGLAICRRLVAALGGTIEVASEPGRGSTFTVALPPEAVDAAGRPAP